MTRVLTNDSMLGSVLTLFQGQTGRQRVKTLGQWGLCAASEGLSCWEERWVGLWVKSCRCRGEITQISIERLR